MTAPAASARRQLNLRNRSDLTWEEWFELWLTYPPNSEGKRLLPSYFTTPEGAKLGTWQDNQRQAYKKGTLKRERIELLEDEGMVWDLYAAAWEVGFQHFQKLTPDADGRRKVTQSYIAPDGFRLGNWYHTQRKAYKNGKLSEVRIRKLERAGVVWDVFEESWEAGLRQFLDYPPDSRGKRIIPQPQLGSGGFQLGLWQENQRQMYKRGELEKSRMERLEEAGIVWEPQEDSWEQAFAAFLAFEPNANGKRMVAATYETEEGFKLGVWQNNQRQARKKGQMSDERIARLEEAGIVWDQFGEMWEAAFQQFQAYGELDNKGRKLVPTGYVTEDGFRLGAWQSTQRAAYKGGSLIVERIERLEAAGMVWFPPDGRRKRAREKRCRDRRRRLQVSQVFAGGLIATDGGGVTSFAADGARLALDAEATRRGGFLLAAEGGLPSEAKGGLLSEAEGRLLSEADAEAAWHEDWRQRLGCWWLALPAPTQAELGHCLGALSVHLGARLERLRGRQTPSAAGAEPGCEWLEGASEELELPDFPSLDGFHFSLPPIPKLLPPWEQLQQLSGAPSASAPDSLGNGLPAAVALAVAAAGAAASSAVFAVGMGFMLFGRQSSRWQHRGQRKASQ